VEVEQTWRGYRYEDGDEFLIRFLNKKLLILSKENN